MAKEILTFPEEYLQDLINVIEAGLSEVSVPEEMYEGLSEWCEYMRTPEEHDLSLFFQLLPFFL